MENESVPCCDIASITYPQLFFQVTSFAFEIGFPTPPDIMGIYSAFPLANTQNSIYNLKKQAYFAC